MRASLATAALCALGLPACAGLRLPFAANAPEPRATPAASPAGSRPHPKVGIADADDFVVRVVAGSVTCTGTLVDEDLVLTAHHCVSERDRYGEFVNRDVTPTSIRVELGGDYFPWGEVAVRAVVAPPCGWAAGTGDIAVLVLDRRLVGVATAEPRLDREPGVGEQLDPMGFGHCASSSEGIRRRSRPGGAVSSVHATRFRMPAAICPGDSGGPVLSRDGNEVVGVISASVMDADETTRGRSELTRVDAWREVFAAARQIADGASPAELPPLGGCPAAP